MKLAEIHKITKELEESNLFKSWKKEHSQSFLSHFFCPLDKEFKPKSAWEIAYYNPEKDKVTVFISINNQFSTKKEDNVFKKPEDKVESLKLNEVKLSFEEAKEKSKEGLKKQFSNSLLGDGFIILQTIKKKTLWNFTFITQKLEFINLKINANTGEVDSHQTVQLIDKGEK